MKRLALCTLLAACLTPAAHAAWLGGEFDTAERISGVVVRSVAVGSPAERAGLRQGDVIIALQLRPLSKAPELNRLVRSSPAGTRVSFGVLRDGTPVEAIAVLGDKPSRSARASTPPAATPAATRLPRHTAWSGVFVETGHEAGTEPRSQSLSHR